MTRNTTVVLAKRAIARDASGAVLEWEYEAVQCPLCHGVGVIEDVPLGKEQCRYCSDQPPYQEQYEVPCQLCAGTGTLFGPESDETEPDADTLRLLALDRSDDPHDALALGEIALQRAIAWAQAMEDDSCMP